MKKLAIIISLATLLFLQPPITFGQENQAVDKNAGQNYFASGDVIRITETINGDAYLWGREVIVEGKINGDLIAAGGTVRIPGTVTQDARIGGGVVNLSGTVGRNLTVGSGNIELTKNSRVEGAVVAGGGEVILAGPIGGSVNVGAGNLVVSDKIDGNLEISTGNLRLTPEASISGNLTYTASGNVTLAPEAKIAGTTTRKEAPQVSPDKLFLALTGTALLMKLLSFLAALITGLIFLYLFPKFVGTTLTHLESQPLKSLGVGLLTLLLIPVIVILLMITLIGIPIALILLVHYLVGLYLAKIIVALWIGRWILRWMHKDGLRFWSLLIGLLIYYLLSLIPILGGLITFFTLLLGLGAIVSALNQARLEAQNKNLL